MSMLAGLRVLEVADGLVDLGGRMLAELGADVISVTPDDTERPHAQTLAWHHGKTRIASGTADVATLRRLAADADVLLDDRRRGDGFGLDDIATENPMLVHVVASPFSREGPYAGRPANDLTLMALSGLMTIVGDPGRPPLRLPGEQAYALTGIQAATAALMGLRARRGAGRGQRIDLSAFQSTTLANYREAIMYEWTGRIGHRTGNRLVRGKSGVRQVWPCADGFVTWSMIDNPAMMRSVVKVLDEHGVAGELAAVNWDAILVADEAQETIERWQAIFGAFFARHTKAELGDWSLARGWGLSVISDLDDVRGSEHLAARGLFVDVEDDDTGTAARLPGPLFRQGAGEVGPPRRLSPPIVADRADWSKRP